MPRLPHNTALLIIDVQEGFDHPQWGRRNNPDMEEKIAALLSYWRAALRPVFFIQHNSIEPDSPLHPALPGNRIKASLAPQKGEPVITKQVNSAFIGTDLETRLWHANIRTLVLVGLTTDHCVSTTARMAGNLNFTTYVVEDATAAFERRSHDGQRLFPADMVHALALASLHQEFAQIVSTTDLLLQPVRQIAS